MKALTVSFSLKGQNVSSIIKQLKKLQKKFNGDDVLLIHSKLPRGEIKMRKMSTELVDKIYELFPIQLNLWKEDTGSLIHEMGYFAKMLNASVYVIGRIDEHVSKEISYYKLYNLEINYIELK